MSFKIKAQTFIKEAEVNEPDYSIPKLLIAQNGVQIKTIKQWEALRRPEILKLFKSEVYGTQPKEIYNLSYKILENDTLALQNLANRKQCAIKVTTERGSLQFNLLL
ncbi:hypothetical protein [Aquimarina celericrescens]|uniref:Uncharacterized protein n=1 Tax=Aquimarina celericrescens TaxID=1964542 RepID=A0ABW5B0E1_9FLAO|nr:hypothetical protein [Aquimarina celericrescens]